MFLGIVLIFIGVILLLERLDIINNGFGTYWPVILIAFGLSMLMRKRRHRG